VGREGAQTMETPYMEMMQDLCNAANELGLTQITYVPSGSKVGTSQGNLAFHTGYLSFIVDRRRAERVTGDLNDRGVPAHFERRSNDRGEVLLKSASLDNAVHMAIELLRQKTPL